jgi:hypothetical protein
VFGSYAKFVRELLQVSRYLLRCSKLAKLHLKMIVEYRQWTRHADVDTVEDRDGVIVTESLVASSELYSLCLHQYII